VSSLTSHCTQVNQPGGPVSASIFTAAAHVPSRAALSRSCHPFAIACNLHEKCSGFLSCVYWTNHHIPTDTPPFALNRLPWVKAGLAWLCPEADRPDRNRQIWRRASGKLFIHKQVSIIRNRKIHVPHGKSDRQTAGMLSISTEDSGSQQGATAPRGKSPSEGPRVPLN